MRPWDFHMFTCTVTSITYCMCVYQVANMSEIVQNTRELKKHTSQPCLIVYLALNSILFSQAQALMKRQHCSEQAGSLL